MSIEVEILDLGVNNLASLTKSVEAAEPRALRVLQNASESKGADLMILPGVGAFGAVVAELKQRGFDELLSTHVASGEYLMGICLGMQLLTESSEETPGSPGLGFIPGNVTRLAPSENNPVPHVGWASVEIASQDNAFPSLAQELDYYFVHSYVVETTSSENVLATTPFGPHTFASAIKKDNVVGFQFHPEKSSNPGKALLRDVLGWARG